MAAKQWSSKFPFVHDNYILRVLSATFGPSKKGSAMITFEMEIASPETKVMAGEEYTIAGTKLRHYVVTIAKDAKGNVDAEKTAKAADRVAELYKGFGIEQPADFNPENPDVSVFVGKVVWAEVDVDDDIKRKTPTAEQAAAGQPGDVMENPVTGEKLETHFPRLVQVFGVATL